MNEHVLKIRNLRIESVAGTTLVDGVDLTVARGEVLGLIGESGAGKSTIGLASMGYARAGCRIVGGTIELEGKELRSLGAEGRRDLRGTRIAYVAQSASASFNPAHTIMRQVCEIPVYHGLMTRAQAKAHAIELFRSLGLPEPEKFGEKYPHEVSGGQLQRAMAAMAIAGKPDILVFDEPTTALDVTTQIEVLALIKKIIWEFGTAALYITHDLAVVAQVADRIMVLRGGRTVEMGTCEQILSAPVEDYTRLLVAERDVHHSLVSDALVDAEKTVLEVDRVNAAYGSISILQDVSLTIAKGETLAVVGESGSGKSSLARVIVGLHSATSGSVRFEKKTLDPNCRNRSRTDQQGIQLVHQHPDVSLNPRQTIGNIIGRPARFYGGLSGRALKQKITELLKMVGLPENFAVRKPGTLSGGQKQRVSIARALAANPALIICDEPTSALDPLVAQEILELLVRLQRELGLSYLFITHDLGIVQRLAHRTLVLLKGEVVSIGATREVFSPPMHPYTQKLIESVPAMKTNWLDGVLAARADRTAREEPTAA
ncbi:ABC transporter ATP-binding protein [Mesorhizobium sp. CGMCC 1.15528]|uniref:ABC transporter ATP-binding protein n=1 Tax=Mesorhizobium zhangyense TaxID=1776730 RepID=A0A7C9VAD4_9HYPH|nr:ABC transporter ATP-binding protein [Mesorhizobium zhangyense]NGN40410.1 ABC transporter ATP-binding protein [Mesorhizobium zhangyense]